MLTQVHVEHLGNLGKSEELADKGDMAKVVHPPVNEELLMLFMVESCLLSGLKLEFRDITSTRMRKEYHPLAAGQLNIVTYALKLADNPTFPIRTPFDYSSEANSTKNLYWLSDLNEKLMKPIAKAPQTRPDLNIGYPPNECGVIRIYPKEVLFVREGQQPIHRKMPKPGAVPLALHLWHKNLCEFHQSYTKKIDNPRLLTPADITILSNKANELHLQLICIKPFMKGNGRIARVIHNMLRLRWGLAWKTQASQKVVEYAKEIMDYEDSEKWQSFLKSINAIE